MYINKWRSPENSANFEKITKNNKISKFEEQTNTDAKDESTK